MLILDLMRLALLFVFYTLGMAMLSSKSSVRLQNTEPPYIENVLEKYAHIPDIKILALGSSYWTPPTEAIDATISNIDKKLHRYGAILGETNLINKLKEKFQQKGVSLEGLDFVITCGANQAFLNVALALCDDKQSSGKFYYNPTTFPIFVTI